MADDLEMYARGAGYSWDEIQQVKAQGSDQALDAGYTPDEIRGYLGGADPQPMQDMSQASWGSALANGVEAEDGQAPDLMSSPSWRSDYANAIDQGHVAGPGDFADQYAASAYNASVQRSGPLDDNTARDLQASFAAQADALRPALPHPNDFTDAALGLDSEDPAAARTNLINHWRDTGTEPADAVAASRNDEDLHTKLTTPKPEPGFFDRLGAGVRDMIGGATQFAEHLLPEGFTSAVNGVNDHLADMGLPLAKVGPDGIDAMEKLRLKTLREQGYDGWVRTGGQIAATLPLFTTLGLEGLGAAIVGGASGGALFAAFSPSEAKDYWAEKARDVPLNAALGGAGGAALHGLFSKIGDMISTMTPEAGAALREAALDQLANPKVDQINPGAAEPSARVPLSDVAPVNPAGMIEVTPDVVAAAKASAGEQAAGGERRLVQGGVKGPAPSEGGSTEGMIEVTPEVHAQMVAEAEARGEIGPSAVKIDPGASSAEKIERLAQLHADNITQASLSVERPNFFQDLYQNAVDRGHLDADPATEELARSHDAASGFRSAITDMLTGVMKDESGALNPPPLRTPAQAAAADAKTEARNSARDLIIKTQGVRNQAIANFSERLDPLMRAMQPHLDEWTGELGKGPGGLPRDTVVGKFLSYVEGRSKGVAIDPNNPLAPFADTVREFNQAIDKRLRQQAADGVIHYDGYIQDYLAHQFVDPAAALDHFGVGSGKLGSKGNLMERQGPPTLLDAIDTGKELKNPDPWHLLISDMTSKLNYSYAADMFDQGAKDGLFRWNTAKLPGDVEVGTGFGRKLYTDADGRPQEIKLFGNPAAVAQVRNWLDNGMYAKPLTAGIYDKLLYAKNTLTALKLALPFFHATTVTIGSIAGSVGRGLEEAGRGQFYEAFRDLGLAPVAPIRDYLAGRRALQAYSTMSGDPIVQALTEQNMRFRGQPLYERLTGDTPGIWSSLLAGRSPAEFARDFAYGDKAKLPYGTLPRDLRQDVRDIFGNAKTEAEGYRALRVPDRALQFGVKETQRIMSLLTEPMFDHAIPTLKAGQAYQRMQSYLSAYPTATEEAVAKYARQVTQDVDNRLGELQLDNVFWSKTAKQIANMGLISTSWVYGSYRGFASALGLDIERHAFEWNPVATTNLIGTLSVFGAANALMTYMHTGKAPRDPWDLVNYRTGENIKFGLGKGLPERGMVPSEVKEIFDLGRIIATAWQTPSHAAGAAVDYALGKFNPFWQAIRSMATGQDGLGHRIAEMPGGWKRFAEENFRPIFMSQIAQHLKGSGLTKAEDIVGFREAPKWVEAASDFQKWQAKSDAKITKEEISRGRYEASRYEMAPWWAQGLPQPNGRAPNAAERARAQYDRTGVMPTNPSLSRELQVMKDYSASKRDKWYSPERERMLGNTLQDRLQRARRAGPFDPMRGY